MLISLSVITILCHSVTRSRDVTKEQEQSSRAGGAQLLMLTERTEIILCFRHSSS